MECVKCKRIVTVDGDHPTPLCPKCGRLVEATLPPDLAGYVKPASGVWWAIGVSAILFIAACISGLAAFAIFNKAQSVMHEILACLFAMNALGCLCGTAVIELLRGRRN